MTFVLFFGFQENYEWYVSGVGAQGDPSTLFRQQSSASDKASYITESLHGRLVPLHVGFLCNEI
jgi:hypothetical protein